MKATLGIFISFALVACNLMPTGPNGGRYAGYPSPWQAADKDGYNCGPERLKDGTLIFTGGSDCNLRSMYQQRRQIGTPSWSQNKQVKYVLEADISMVVPDGRGIGPRGNHVLNIATENAGGCTTAYHWGFVPSTNYVKTGHWERFKYYDGTVDRICREGGVVYEDMTGFAGSKAWAMPLDGTEFRWRAELDFKGQGNFDARIYVDGKMINEFSFTRPEKSIYKQQYHLDFGSYFRDDYEYTMTVKNFTFSKVDNFQR